MSNSTQHDIILHDFRRDKDGKLIYQEGSERHNDVECVRCHEYFCVLCEPEKLKEPCEEQTPYLF